MDKDTLQALSDRIDEYTKSRDWDQFHTPKNLIMAICGEAGELSSVLQWDNSHKAFSDKKTRSRLEDESADLLIYLIKFSTVVGFDLIDAANRKIDTIDQRYPIDKCRGVATKATDL